MTTAHGPITPSSLLEAWSVEPVLFASLVITACGYAIGWKRLISSARHVVGARRLASFLVGLLCIAGTVLSPLHAVGQTLLSAHMVQHLLLLLVAAPLLVYGVPGRVLPMAAPRKLRRWGGRLAARRPVRAFRRALRNALLVWAIHTAVMWMWHHPALYRAGINSETVHGLQHALFVAAAFLLWRIVLPARPARENVGVASAVAFGTLLQSGALGALLTFASRSLYGIDPVAAAAWGVSPLQDQQLAGVIMWIPAGAVYMIATAWLFASWLRAIDATRAHVHGIERL
jgi:putative membrane protein